MVGDLLQFSIAFAVSTNIGKSIGFGWIGPKVGSLAHVVVLVATGRNNGFLHDREGSFVYRLIRSGGNCSNQLLLSGVACCCGFELSNHLSIEKKDAGRYGYRFRSCCWLCERSVG